MTFTKASHIKLSIPRSAVEVVFDECDRYDADETGGRILGTYDKSRSALNIKVNGVIEPGPNAARTATYFKQDGAYQERIFRQVEEREPSVEHLGNWHTHHMNGLRHLSEGDIETYRRTVEHHNHNTDFFYALLVIEKKRGKAGLERYIFKNYVFQRGDPSIYEIPSSALTLTDEPLVWPADPDALPPKRTSAPAEPAAIRINRVYDQDIVKQFYPKIRTFQSKELGIYWRGTIRLVDGSDVDVVVIETEADATPQYSITIRQAPAALAKSAQAIAAETFPSCRAALITIERMCNEELYIGRSKRGRKWMF